MENLREHHGDAPSTEQVNDASTSGTGSETRLPKLFIAISLSLLLLGGLAFGINKIRSDRQTEKLAISELESTKLVCQKMQVILNEDLWGDSFSEIKNKMVSNASRVANFSPRDFVGWGSYQNPLQGDEKNSIYSSFYTREAFLVAGAMRDMQEKYQAYATYRILVASSPNLDGLEAKASKVTFENSCLDISKAIRNREYQVISD